MRIPPHCGAVEKDSRGSQIFYPVRVGQGGNIFFALFGAVALIGVLGSVTMNLMRGPVTGMTRVTDYTLAKNDMVAAMVMISEKTLSRADADCDGDGMIEPLAPRMELSAPTGGGLVPDNIGVSVHDPWRRDYGYCAWDHGFWTRDHDVAACGGAGSGRLNGANAETQSVIALISAGPNGLFETSCHDYIDDDQSLVTSAAGSDDLVRVVPYGQFMMPSAATARLDALPDSACTPGSIGLMRFVLGVVQLCSETGWIEIAPASGGDIHFEPVTNSMIGTSHQSNTVTFGALSADLPTSVTGGATMSINGGPPVTNGTIRSGDTLRLFGTAPSVPETTHAYTVQLGAVNKSWSITTRDAYIGKLKITPATTGAMNVAGPGNPAYGATVGFIISNEGERPVGPLMPAQLSNTTHFAFHSGGPYVGDGCAGKVLNGTLSGAQSCVIDVRPRATADIAYYEGTLSTGDGNMSISAALSGSATGWGCTVPWGGYIANGASVTAYREKCNLLGCAAQTRQCTNGVLSGTYQHATCSSLLGCIQ